MIYLDYRTYKKLSTYLFSTPRKYWGQSMRICEVLYEELCSIFCIWNMGQYMKRDWGGYVFESVGSSCNRSMVIFSDCESNILLFLYIVNRIRTYILIISVIYYYCIYLANRHRGMHVAGGVCGVYIYVDKLKNQDKV